MDFVDVEKAFEVPKQCLHCRGSGGVSIDHRDSVRCVPSMLQVDTCGGML